MCACCPACKPAEASEPIIGSASDMGLWLSQHGFEGLLAEVTSSLANAEQHLRDNRHHGLCQSSATRVSFFMDNMFFDSNVMASYLRDNRPSASLFSLIKSRLGVTH